MSRNAVRALFDEWDRAREDLVRLLPRIRPAELEGGDPADSTRARGILIHILRADMNYANWICEVLGRPRPERAIDTKLIDGRAEFEAGFAAVRDYFETALEQLTDADLDAPEGATSPLHFKARWGEDYGVEQMLEHAVCHHLRHRRQLERMAIY